MVPVRFVETKPRGAEVPLGPRAVLALEVATVAPQWRAASLSRVLKPGSDGRFYVALTQQKEVAGAGRWPLVESQAQGAGPSVGRQGPGQRPAVTSPGQPVRIPGCSPAWE